MEKFVKILLCVLLSTFSSSLFGGEIVKAMSSATKRSQVFAVLLSHEKHIKFFGEPIVGDALVVCGANEKMRFEILKPYRSVSIFDGTNFSQYEFEDGAWLKLGANAELAKAVNSEIRRMFSGDFSEAGKLYSISESAGKVILVPKNSVAAKFVAKIEITPNKSRTYPEKIEILTPDADKTILKISKVILLKSEPAGAFEVASPERFNSANFGQGK